MPVFSVFIYIFSGDDGVCRDDGDDDGVRKRLSYRWQILLIHQQKHLPMNHSNSCAVLVFHVQQPQVADKPAVLPPPAEAALVPEHL